MKTAPDGFKKMNLELKNYIEKQWLEVSAKEKRQQRKPEPLAAHLQTVWRKRRKTDRNERQKRLPFAKLKQVFAKAQADSKHHIYFYPTSLDTFIKDSKSSFLLNYIITLT